MAYQQRKRYYNNNRKNKSGNPAVVRRFIYLIIIVIIAFVNFISTHPGGNIDQITGNYQDYQVAENESDLYYNWDESIAPEYYYVNGKAKVDKEPNPGTIITSDLDSKGRTHGVTATVTYKMVEDSRGWREEFGPEDDPSGWGNNEEVQIQLSDGSYYSGWFWNRSHLLADSLGGHADRNNVITGTRMQNVGSNNSNNPGGMAYTETKARNWLYAHHDGTIYYSATPVYKDNELIPRSVVVNIRTSDGSIDECVIVYNYAKGYEIDYTSPEGEFRKK